MEQLMKKYAHNVTQRILDRQEECPLSGEYTLPEYCPDIAVVLKCFAYPHIQNRQWSGDQMLLDGNAVVRVLYLDEERRCLHSLEFAQPFSCTLRGSGRVDNAAVEIELVTKYLTCRALSPRRIEVRGAIVVTARADSSVEKDFLEPADSDKLYARTEIVKTTIPIETCDKIMTVNEALEFDASLPPAEMLLGGECRAVLRECKLLSGKAIVKGQIFLHQIYTDSLEGTSTYSLDYTIPFSHILDVEHAQEGMPLHAMVHVLSDIERCTVGPDGENTVLGVSVKLLLQLHLYSTNEIMVLKDAYHARYPVAVQSENMEICSMIGTRWEESVLPLSVSLPSHPWKEIVDVWVQPQECATQCDGYMTEVKGRMAIGVVARDTDDEIVYQEFLEDYRTEYPCRGNAVHAQLVISGIKYRVTEDKLELQITLCSAITDYNRFQETVITDLRLQQDAPYPTQNATTLLYYADSGDSVWDIGKACHTSPTAIAKENDMTEEVLSEAAVLIVPIFS